MLMIVSTRESVCATFAASSSRAIEVCSILMRRRVELCPLNPPRRWIHGVVEAKDEPVVIKVLEDNEGRHSKRRFLTAKGP